MIAKSTAHTVLLSGEAATLSVQVHHRFTPPEVVVEEEVDILFALSLT